MPHPWKLRPAKRRAAQEAVLAEDRHTGKGRVDRRLWDQRRRHVQARAFQRFRLILTHDDIALMEDGIRLGRSVLLADEPRRGTELHEMVWCRKTLYPVYDVAQGYIRTILPEAYARSNFCF
jgi:hypothetical protein